MERSFAASSDMVVVAGKSDLALRTADIKAKRYAEAPVPSRVVESWRSTFLWWSCGGPGRVTVRGLRISLQITLVLCRHAP